MKTWRIPCACHVRAVLVPPTMTIAEMEARMAENVRFHAHAIEAETAAEARAIFAARLRDEEDDR